MEKLNIEVKPLFKIRLDGEERLASQDSIDYFKKWWTNSKLEIVEELGEIDLGALEIFITGSHKARCYVSVDYKVISEKPLDSFGLAVLRASGNFQRGAGQEVGKLYRSEEVDGKFTYDLKSVCDSSD